MKKSISLLIILTLSLLTGCGGDTAESVSKEIVANMKEMGTILNSIDDEASAKAAVPKIEAVRAKMRAAAQRAKNVPKIDAATEAKIAKDSEQGMNEAMASIMAAQQKLSTQPQLLAIIEPAMQNMDADM